MLFVSSFSFGQISQGGLPYSFSKTTKLKSTLLRNSIEESISEITMSIIDNSAIDAIKQQNELTETHQFAYSFDVDIDVKKSSTIDSLNIGLLYRLSIKSKDAFCHLI